jgi:hypothetical protein
MKWQFPHCISKIQQSSIPIKSENDRDDDTQLSKLSLRERMKQKSAIARKSILTLELLEDEDKLKRKRNQLNYAKYHNPKPQNILNMQTRQNSDNR